MAINARSASQAVRALKVSQLSISNGNTDKDSPSLPEQSSSQVFEAMPPLPNQTSRQPSKKSFQPRENFSKRSRE